MVGKLLPTFVGKEFPVQRDLDTVSSWVLYLFDVTVKVNERHNACVGPSVRRIEAMLSTYHRQTSH